jgi:hypothetical protein
MMVTLTALRDVSIILVAVESIFIGIMLTVLVIQLAKLTKMLREEVLPVLTAAQDTVSTVRGTTTFVSDHVVQPVVKVASVWSGVRGAFGALVGIRTLSDRRSGAKTSLPADGHGDQ